MSDSNLIYKISLGRRKSTKEKGAIIDIIDNSQQDKKPKGSIFIYAGTDGQLGTADDRIEKKGNVPTLNKNTLEKCLENIKNANESDFDTNKKTDIKADEIKTTAENIFSCAKGNSCQLDMLLKSELLRLFWLLENNGDIYRKSDSNSDFIGAIRPAVEYINDNYCENITVQQLADIVHLSKSYFMSRFRQAAGVGAIEYITQLRIKKACARLLSDSNMNTADIAFECGFRNLSNFNRQFRKAVGCTPCEYKKINSTRS